MKLFVHTAFVVLVLLVLQESSVLADVTRSCELKSRVIVTTNITVDFEWTYSCADANTRYKVYYEHVQWFACDGGFRDESRGTGKGNLETTETRKALSDLNPYSRYRLDIKALSDNLKPVQTSLYAETQPGIPGVIPERSHISTEVTSSRLRFFWSEIPKSLCRDFNGNLTGFYYDIVGGENWNERFEYSGETASTSVIFDNLLPFSKYILFVYARNENGLRNFPPLTLRAQTAQSRPGKPVFIDASSLADSVRLRWQPAYPPTGLLHRFTLKWKQSDAEDWTDQLVVPYDVASSTCSTEYKCYTVSELDTSKNFTFKVAAYNVGVDQRSQWSDEIVSDPYSPEKGPKEDSELTTVHWVLIVIFVCLAFLLIFVIISYKCIKSNPSRLKYNNVPVYEPSSNRLSLPSRYDPEPPDSEQEMPSREYSRSIQDIPLPPVPGEHLYEELPEKKIKDTNVDEEMYLVPKTGCNKDQLSQSSETLDVDEYLKPTFNRLDPLNLTLPDSDPPPIPIQSYEQVKV